MDEYDKYAALADTTEIEDITSNTINQSILQRLKDNDLEFTTLVYTTNHFTEQESNDHYYLPSGREDVGWLGYYIGQNTKLQELIFYQTNDNESFYIGMSNNRSINRLVFCDESNFEKLFPLLGPFFKNNHNLNEIEVEDTCQLVYEEARQLSLAIGKCNNSLKSFAMTCSFAMRYSPIDISRSVADIITALSMHPQLTKLCLSDINIGRNEYMALSTLLRCTITQLEILNLSYNNINNEGVELLVQALSKNNQLQDLDLSNNEDITITGWKAVSTLLELPDTKLKTLKIIHNNIGDEEALVFANALVNNSTLDNLDLDYCRITERGWAPLVKLLCDASSVNKLYLSNHTIEGFGSSSHTTVTDGVRSLLALNRNANKQQVAITKILQSHSHFNMQPFFEWEFKVLPIMVNWFKTADSCTAFEHEEKISRLKLSTVYDFIKEFPMLYIEPMTRKEIAKYTTTEEELLQGGLLDAEQEVKLEEIRSCKARAIKRLGQSNASLVI